MHARRVPGIGDTGGGTTGKGDTRVAEYPDRVLQIGLKLWSVNTGAWRRDALRLYEQGAYDYLEIYVVPGTVETVPLWRALRIPVVIHAAHFKHGFNLAVAECATLNRRIYEETLRFADELEARHIIFHGGTFGHIEETARQLAALGESRALIENKPAITRHEGNILECRGSTVEEIRTVIEATGCGFCLDIPHALCAANYHRESQEGMLRDFLALRPTMYHIADMMDASQLIDDHTPLGKGTLDLAHYVSSIPSEGALVTIETGRRRQDSLVEFEAELETWAQCHAGPRNLSPMDSGRL